MDGLQYTFDNNNKSIMYKKNSSKYKNNIKLLKFEKQGKTLKSD